MLFLQLALSPSSSQVSCVWAHRKTTCAHVRLHMHTHLLHIKALPWARLPGAEPETGLIPMHVKYQGRTPFRKAGREQGWGGAERSLGSAGAGLHDARGRCGMKCASQQVPPRAQGPPFWAERASCFHCAEKWGSLRSWRTSAWAVSAQIHARGFTFIPLSINACVYTYTHTLRTETNACTCLYI